MKIKRDYHVPHLGYQTIAQMDPKALEVLQGFHAVRKESIKPGLAREGAFLWKEIHNLSDRETVVG